MKNGQTLNPAPANLAHLIIDVQALFCEAYRAYGTEHTENIAERILETSNDLRSLGIKTIIVYMDTDNKGIDNACMGLYKIEKQPGDIPIPKTEDCAFEGSNLEEVLNYLNVNRLLVSGFNAGACVKDTVLSGLQRRFKIALMADCIGQDEHEEFIIPEELRQMQKAGALITSSEEILIGLCHRALRTQPQENIASPDPLR